MGVVLEHPADTPLTGEEQKVLAALSRTPIEMDDLIEQLDIPAGQVLKIITKLSLDGKIENHPGRLVSLR